MHLLILNTLLFSFALYFGCPLREHHNRHLCKKVQRFLFILQFKLRNNLIENVNKCILSLLGEMPISSLGHNVLDYC